MHERRTFFCGTSEFPFCAGVLNAVADTAYKPMHGDTQQTLCVDGDDDDDDDDADDDNDDGIVCVRGNVSGIAESWPIDLHCLPATAKKDEECKRSLS